MKNNFSLEEVNKIARLSALELKDSELKNFGDQFVKILEYFKLLDEAIITEPDTDRFEKNCHLDREDKVLKSTVSPEHFSNHLSDQFFRIPRVIDQEK